MKIKQMIVKESPIPRLFDNPRYYFRQIQFTYDLIHTYHTPQSSK